MTTEEHNHYRKLLEEQKAEFLETLGESLEAAKGIEFDQQRVGRLSRMDALQSQAISQAANRRIASELQDIDAALERLERGTYGNCRSCGDPIAAARLEAYPSTPFCIACARRGG